MNGIPADFDASVFLGKEVEQIAMAINQIAIWFGQDTGIVAESEFRFSSSRGGEASVRTDPPQAMPLAELLGRRVTKAEARDGNHLHLTFDSGAGLSFSDSSADYECFHIIVGAREIHV